MIKEFKQSVGFSCPACGTASVRDVNIFDLSGKKKISFSCAMKGCGIDNVSLSLKNDKYVIDIICPFCSSTHTLTVQSSSFWAKESFSYKCPVSDMEILFIGDREKIKKLIKKQEALLEDMSDSLLSELNIGHEFEIIVDILSELNDMCEERAVYCTCGSEDIAIGVEEDGISVSCNECGEEVFINPTQKELDKLISKDIFIIKNK